MPQTSAAPCRYYTYAASGSNGRLVIYLEAGGMCFTDTECTARFGQQPLMGTSTGMPTTYRGSKMLAGEGVFAGADLLVAHYCTSSSACRAAPCMRRAGALLFLMSTHGAC